MPAARFQTLSQWLEWLEELHPKAIDLGLGRISSVARNLGLIGASNYEGYPFSGSLCVDKTKVITVAGTNGKGSCITALEQCLLARQLQVGTYTSPHLHHYCERVHLNGNNATEAQMCEAFCVIDNAREDISLTYFEFGTLAALWLFAQQPLDVIILEVGLGGRLDAANIVDTDIAVITSIALDHESWLGNDLGQIALEKAGIARPDKVLISAVVDAPETLQELVVQHAHAHQLGRDFLLEKDEHLPGLTWVGGPALATRVSLPQPSLPATSIAAALQVLATLGDMPDTHELERICSRLALAGRYQCVEYQQRHLIFDVAHNPAAAQALANRLAQIEHGQAIVAVMGVMADKDIAGIVDPLVSVISRWYIGELANIPRAASAATIATYINAPSVYLSASVFTGFQQALADSEPGDTIVIFGSFFSVADVQLQLGIQ